MNINTLGCAECRQVYREVLKTFLSQKEGGFCEDCLRRRDTNPLRVFDCKVKSCVSCSKAPRVLIDHVCSDCRAHFDAVRGCLDKLGTRYAVNPRIVRGLDYYMRTTFEVITDRLGSQNAIGGGGRYNGLVRDLGGPDVAAMGFAMGMERLVLLLRAGKRKAGSLRALFLSPPWASRRVARIFTCPAVAGALIETEMDYEGRSLKSQMRRADKSGARYVLILGEEELAGRQIQLRDMLTKTQRLLPLEDIVEQPCSRLD